MAGIQVIALLQLAHIMGELHARAFVIIDNANLPPHDLRKPDGRCIRYPEVPCGPNRQAGLMRHIRDAFLLLRLVHELGVIAPITAASKEHSNSCAYCSSERSPRA